MTTPLHILYLIYEFYHILNVSWYCAALGGLLRVIFRWLFDQRKRRFLNNKSSLRFTSIKSEYQWHIRNKCCWGVCTKHQPPLFSSSQQILPHVCLLFHKHRGYARQMGPQSGPRETESRVRITQSRQQGQAGDVTTHTALSEAADVDQTGVTECAPGFVFVYMEVVPAV